jgi:tetratricopeptide (TPR) repeat protein
MSVCTNNTEDFRETVMNCSKANEIDPTATKALYLRSVAHVKLNELDEAMADIKAAIKLAPSDGNLRAHFELIKKERADKAKKAKAGLAKFFSEGVYNEKDAVRVEHRHERLPDFNSENV